ncbi:hypothetical protein [Pseudomonas typographi]|uniref:Uncharacterized protein n=1 Tax=Pseudomonas typographi TaxID=2715964 RepID=A0ABR7ZA70_9PSED|nr:hypothetical protein [Pseudomonas typographi]MBD1554262.1 hypothetical protein [Pseudomonas typographi]MBD1602272.1 hypothetical protein [Pseudomonas typographi]
MISMEYGTIQHKDTERAWLSQAMAEFEQRKGLPQTLPITARCEDIETLFNNRTQAGRHTELNTSMEDRVVAAGPTLTRAQAAERFHLSMADLNAIADRHGFKFKRGYTTNQTYKEGDAGLVERITALRDVGLNRAQVMKQTGMSYDRFHRLLKDYSIDFPKRSNGGYAGRKAS